ncbi:hypothetical protein FCI23_28000, partial [Actinacidiphila oryziradicis]
GLPGVFYSLALTFGTLLSSQGTEASFETVSPAPPGFPFVFPSLPDPFRPDSRWRDSYFCLPGLSAVPTSETLADPRPLGPIERFRFLISQLRTPKP